LKSTPPFPDTPSLVADRIQLIKLADIVGRMPSLEIICIPFLYGLPTGKQPFRRH